ncbi:MAG: hypothetical protein K9J06_04440 [Flavobacteriales bacterium]|nr:hypothetical protein [Flavobacteriales bacterium]
MRKSAHIVVLILALTSCVSAQQEMELTDTTKLRAYIQFMYYPEQWQPERDTINYVLEGGPDIWYNGYDGLKLGVQLAGGLADRHHVFNAFLWAHTGIGQYGLPDGSDRYGFMPLSFSGDYRTSLHSYWRNSTVRLAVRALDGLYGGKVGLTKGNRKGDITFGLWFKAMYRPERNGLPYLLDRQHWDMGRWNNSFAATLEYQYSYGTGTGELDMVLRSSNLGSDHDYHYIRTTAINRTELWMLKLHSRVFLQLGYGTDWASESMLYLDRASPEEMADSRLTGSAGIFPSQWAEYGVVQNHFHHGGGLNLRGYSGYLAPEQRGDEILMAHSGVHGAAVNLELEFDRLLGSDKWPMRKYLRLNTYFFADAGIISINASDAAPAFAMPRADAGVGVAFTVRQWGPITRLHPITLRFDMPLFVSRPAALQPGPWQFRWVLGVARAF